MTRLPPLGKYWVRRKHSVRKLTSSWAGCFFYIIDTFMHFIKSLLTLRI
nr:MAG TPA: hypothetical protein [Caudoviricetes sp.]